MPLARHIDGVRLITAPTLPDSRSAFNEGISNRQPSDLAAVLHILAVERVAAGLGGGRNDKGIIEGKAVFART